MVYCLYEKQESGRMHLMKKLIVTILVLGLLLYACCANRSQPDSALSSLPSKTSSHRYLESLPEPAEGTNLIVIKPGESWGEFGPGEYIMLSIFELSKHMHRNTRYVEQLENYGVRPELIQQIFDNDYDYELLKQAEKELIEAGFTVPTVLVSAEDYPDFVRRNTSAP